MLVYVMIYNKHTVYIVLIDELPLEWLIMSVMYLKNINDLK